MSEGEEGREKGITKLKSFIHEHPLTLLDELINAKDCNECGLYITGPTYVCNTCEFFIHKSCVELPSEIHHPLHPNHLLFLAKPPSPPSFNGIFFCELCTNVRDGFSYYCAECHYALDSHCALSIPTVIQHVKHEHPLNLAHEAYFHCPTPNCKHILGINDALLPPIGKHRTHRHQLKLTFVPPNEDYPEEEEEYYCDACEELRSPDGLLYCCETCDFTAHTSCIASRPLRLFSPVKPSLSAFNDRSHEHVLTLMPVGTIKCAICTVYHGKYCYYRCEECDYNVCARSATKLPRTCKIQGEEAEEEEQMRMSEERVLKKGVIMDIKQRHQHPLAFSDVQRNNQRCNVCRLPLSGANYHCNSCQFFLHESCTKLPAQIEYIIERNRNWYQNLILAEPPSPLYLNDVFLCAICNTPGDGFSYHCLDSVCRLALFVCHVDCALNKPQTVTHKCHKHPLLLLSRPMFRNPLCCACGSKVNDLAYYCDKCDIAVDVECAHLATTVSHDSHPHPLHLTANIEEPFYCNVCGEEREWKGWAYTCGDCKFIAHMCCVCEGDPSPFMELGGTLEHQNHEHVLTLARRHKGTSQCSHCDKLLKRKLVYQCLECNYNLDLECASRRVYAKPIGWIPEEKERKGRNAGEVGGGEMAPEVEHFSHDHPLVLSDVQTKGERCSGCRLAISGGPSYGCTDCNVSLHKSCLELPRKIMFPFHRHHPLDLSEDPPPPFNDGIFYCCLCGTPGDGFSYSCAECDKIVLHVHCALRTPMEIRIAAAHKDLLHLEWCTSTFGIRRCAACKLSCEGIAFSCRNGSSSFNLHVNCALLPPQKKYRSHRHVLTLKYRHVEEESDEYYCDACEELRDPEAWVYKCEESKDCDFVAHTSCDEPFPFLKLGGTRKIRSHNHPITLVIKKADIHQYTDQKLLLSGLRYQCTECTYQSDDLLLLSLKREEE